MGDILYRRFISFVRLRNPADFVKIKKTCMKLEKKLSLSGRRQVNIDPGYLDLAKVVLLTHKDFYHRICLDNEGIFAEVTLYYQKHNFCEFSTTYPDYRSKKYKEIFSMIRNIYKSQISKK